MAGYIPAVNERARSSIDDLALYRVTAQNNVAYDYNEGVYQTKATALVFIKSKMSEIPCKQPSHCFYGGHWGYSHPYTDYAGFSSYIWWKKFPFTITTNKMRQIVAREAWDYLYKRIHGDGYPVVAARAVLFDWTTQQPILPETLNNDPLYDIYGFYHRFINKQAMRLLNVPYYIADSSTQQTNQYNYNNDQRFDVTHLSQNDLMLLFHDYHIDIKSITSEAYQNTHLRLKHLYGQNSQNYFDLAKQLQLFVLRTDTFNAVYLIILNKLKNDQKWRDLFMNMDDKQGMITDIVQNLCNNYIDSLIV